MALTIRRSHYWLVIIYTSFVLTGCITNNVKEKSPLEEQQPAPTCPVKEQDSTKHILTYSTLKDLPSSIFATERKPFFPETFAFRYDAVVDNLLNPVRYVFPHLQITLPQTDWEQQLSTLSQDVLANHPLQEDTETKTRVLNLFDRSENFRQIEAMLNEARGFVGVPYRRGGTSPRGFDCSGLVYYTLKHRGVSVPRTAHAQYLHSKPIEKSELRPGDLVFFRTNRRTQRITHVGIYLGNNRFIHARSGGRKVDITSLSDNYYKQRFVRGGRVL